MSGSNGYTARRGEGLAGFDEQNGVHAHAMVCLAKTFAKHWPLVFTLESNRGPARGLRAIGGARGGECAFASPQFRQRNSHNLHSGPVQLSVGRQWHAHSCPLQPARPAPERVRAGYRTSIRKVVAVTTFSNS